MWEDEEEDLLMPATAFNIASLEFLANDWHQVRAREEGEEEMSLGRVVDLIERLPSRKQIELNFDPSRPCSVAEFTSLLSATIGGDSKLLVFCLRVECKANVVTEALEEVLPNMSPRLQKIKLCFISGDSNSITKARILAALERNTAVLNLRSFDLVLQTPGFPRFQLHHGARTLIPDFERQVSAFVVKKSIQRICAKPINIPESLLPAVPNRPMTRVGFPLEALPQALAQIQGHPHLDTHKYSATMLFHCLRSNYDLQKKVIAHLQNPEEIQE